MVPPKEGGSMRKLIWNIVIVPSLVITLLVIGLILGYLFLIRDVIYDIVWDFCWNARYEILVTSVVSWIYLKFFHKD